MKVNELIYKDAIEIEYNQTLDKFLHQAQQEILTYYYLYLCVIERFHRDGIPVLSNEPENQI